MNAGCHPDRVFLRPGRFCGRAVCAKGLNHRVLLPPQSPRRRCTMPQPERTRNSERCPRSEESLWSLNFPLPRYEIGTRKIFLRMLTFVYANISARKTESDLTSIM